MHLLIKASKLKFAWLGTIEDDFIAHYYHHTVARAIIMAYISISLFSFFQMMCQYDDYHTGLQYLDFDL